MKKKLIENKWIAQKGMFTNPDNWSLHHVPMETECAVIESGTVEVRLMQDWIVGGMIIGANARVEYSGVYELIVLNKTTMNFSDEQIESFKNDCNTFCAICGDKNKSEWKDVDEFMRHVCHACEVKLLEKITRRMVERYFRED